MIRRALIAVAACAFLVGCGDDDATTSPSAAPMVFTGILSPANEVPPVGNAESSGRGAVQITVTGSTAEMGIPVARVPRRHQDPGAHIHPGGRLATDRHRGYTHHGSVDGAVEEWPRWKSHPGLG